MKKFKIPKSTLIIITISFMGIAFLLFFITIRKSKPYQIVKKGETFKKIYENSGTKLSYKNFKKINTHLSLDGYQHINPGDTIWLDEQKISIWKLNKIFSLTSKKEQKYPDNRLKANIFLNTPAFHMGIIYNKFYTNVREKRFRVKLTSPMKKEIIQEFNQYSKKGKDKIQKIVNFTNDYVAYKLSYRYSLFIKSEKRRKWYKKFPLSKRILPPKKNEYFQNLGYINIIGEKSHLTDCWDYAQLYKNVFNFLSKKYGLNAQCIRLIGDTNYNIFGKIKKSWSDHDFNLIIYNNKKIYVDPTFYDIWHYNTKVNFSTPYLPGY
jgi:ASC-1-like (ASCH) protein